MDPGITTGIAILDANGNVLNIYSKRNVTKGEVTRHILKFGKPIIISSDVKEIPKSVEKIGVKLGCIIYSPEESLSVNDKRELSKSYRDSFKNNHEMDALSAAIKAWKHYRVLFNKVNEVVSRFGRHQIFSDVVVKLVKEGGPNIEDLVRDVIEKSTSSSLEKKQVIQSESQRNLIQKLQKSVFEKQRQIEFLKNQNISLSDALNSVKKEIKSERQLPIPSMKSDDTILIKDSLDYVKKIRMLENKGYYPLIEIDKLDSYSIKHIDDMIDLENMVVIVKDESNLNLLNMKPIKCLVLFKELEDSQKTKLEFPVIKADEKDVETVDGIKALKTDYIEKKLADAKKSGLVSWLRGYRKRKE